ncbi:ComF family protein [Psychromonas sp. KJ10-10]|uniref:ComF family protein n=1 Tax=Psychromonas sp. KJ10-10 TaxID=3391823 RepID=UPI0039B3C5DE
MFHLIKQQSKQIIEHLLPAQCLVCALTSNNKLICLHCEKNILSQRQYCFNCALPLNNSADYCGDCLQKDYIFDHIHALGDYTKPLSILIKQLKYQKSLISGELLAELLLKSVLNRYSKQQLSEYDYLLATPLHSKKLRLRGFNQTQIIADSLHKSLNIPLLENAIIRDKQTTAQEGLSVTKRRKNLANAFKLKQSSTQEIAGKNIIIIDDVVTTGATMNSLCKYLKKQGANKLTIFCISRTALNKEI